MSEVVLAEQLEQAINAMLRDPGAAPPAAADQRMSELLGIAAELRDLPRQDFRARLKSEIEGRAAMSTATQTKESADKGAQSKVNPIREDFRTVTPYLTVQDVDRVYHRAVQAGATSLMAPTDMEYGERGAAIQDVGGNNWYIATSNGPNYIPEDVPNLMPYFNPRGAPKMIEFLKQAFGAEEVAVYQSADGIVHHAKIRIGDSIVEMGEAHGPWQPRPITFMIYADDCDAWYTRAMKAEGAISIDEPADQPYGGRVAAVKDPFDNVWYISSHT